MVNEEWRLIHDDYYEVSNLGNVRRAKPGIATFVGRPVLPIIGMGGYAQLALSGLKKRRAYVHHLVAEAFIGPRPVGFVINHKDANKTNNSIENLEYVTYSENAKHAVKNVVRRKGPKKTPSVNVGPQIGESHWTARRPDLIAKGTKMPHSKMTADQVLDARNRVAGGEMQKTVAKEMNVSGAQMSRIIRGTRWKYL